MGTPVLIALGGNQGDVRATGEAALAQLEQIPGVSRIRPSRWYSTEPVGCAGRFLNAAAVLETELTPAQLLLEMHVIEARHGRVRTAHWSPRPLDLDLVLYGEQQIETPTLRIPHPACWYRRFVLDPACEVAGAFRHPGLKLTLNELLARLAQRPLRIHGAGLPDWQSIFNHPALDPYRSRISDGESHTAQVRFVDHPPTAFEIEVPLSQQARLQSVVDALTAMLDEPQPVD